jgi:hypothetical protein
MKLTWVNYHLLYEQCHLEYQKLGFFPGISIIPKRDKDWTNLFLITSVFRESGRTTPWSFCAGLLEVATGQ